MAALSMIDHLAMRDRVVAALRQAIFQGELKPGERLQEERLASLIGAGRGPVREALLKLEAEGLVVREPYKGARVAMPTHEEMNEIFAIREVLEAMATRLATPHMTPEDICRLREVLELRKREENQEKIGEESLNLGFHEIIYDRCPNRHLRELVQQYWGRFPKSTWRLRPPGKSTNLVYRGTEEYEAVLEAIEAGDSELAAARMQEHVRAGRDRLLELIDLVQLSGATNGSDENGRS